MGQSQVCFYQRDEDNWKYQSPKSIGNRVFGWINDYSFANAPLDQWVKNHKNSAQIVTVSGIGLHQHLFKLLKFNRIDTFAEDKTVIAYELKKAGLDKEIRIAGCLKSIDENHLAFSLKSKHKEQWAKALDSGVEQLYKNGRLDIILSIYGLTKENWR